MIKENREKRHNKERVNINKHENKNLSQGQTD